MIKLSPAPPLRRRNFASLASRSVCAIDSAARPTRCARVDAGQLANSVEAEIHRVGVEIEMAGGALDVEIAVGESWMVFSSASVARMQRSEIRE